MPCMWKETNCVKGLLHLKIKSMHYVWKGAANVNYSIYCYTNLETKKIFEDHTRALPSWKTPPPDIVCETNERHNI